MKLLFVAYCFGSAEGQALIGVYKRGLRLAMALADRGHEIDFFCTGREAYEDDMTRAAESRMRFIDIPFTVASHGEARRNSQVFRRTIANLAPDIVVIGEAPLAGAMLEATLTAAELGIPVTLLDNAYNGLFVELFLQTVGPIADGLVLMGPGSHHLEAPPPFLCQVPPLIHSDGDAARALVDATFDAGTEHGLVVVLAYDAKVERLAISLLPRLCEEGATVLFCTRDTDACRARWPELPTKAAARVAAITQPPEATLIGLLEIARLAIVKYGFMQVAECLTLKTPAIVVYHEGPTWLDYLPDCSRRFAWVTSSPTRDRQTVKAAVGFLALAPTAMDGIHHGGLDAIAQTAAFLESLPRRPRATDDACSALGFGPDVVAEALAQACPETAPELRSVRALRLRVDPEGEIYAVICRLAGTSPPAVRLWGRRYPDTDTATADAEKASRDPERRMLHFDPTARIAIEVDLGEALLPVLNP